MVKKRHKARMSDRFVISFRIDGMIYFSVCDERNPKEEDTFF